MFKEAIAFDRLQEQLQRRAFARLLRSRLQVNAAFCSHTLLTGMERIAIRARRWWALKFLLAAIVMLVLMPLAGFNLMRGRNPSGALPAWWIQLLAVSLFGLFTLAAALGVRMAWRALKGVPRATLDDEGIHLQRMGLIEWADVRDVEVVRRRQSGTHLRIALDPWGKYLSRLPRWLQWLERRQPHHQGVMLDLAGSDADAIALSTVIRDAAARHRRPAAEPAVAPVRRDV